MTRVRPRLMLVAVLATVGPVTVGAQSPDSIRPIPARPGPQDPPDTAGLPITPRGAFIRSVILPGWGQSKFESYFRGGVYYAGWAGNWFMLFRNEYRLESARTRFDIRADQIEAELVAASPNPDSLQAQIDSFPGILDPVIREDSLGNALRKLVRARDQQREDWIAWSLFWLLASGIDAYVTAHLADFPAAIELRPNRDQSVTLRLEVPLHRRRP